MTRYMVVHTPNDDSEEHTNPPTRLHELAEACGKEDSVPRWVSTITPDLNDDRMFSMWEAPNADSVRDVIEEYGFLNHLDSKVFAIREWGTQDVLEASDKKD